jgi:hypothetical protein
MRLSALASGRERHAELPRVVGTGGALLLGLGSGLALVGGALLVRAVVRH